MTAASTRTEIGWAGRSLIGLVLILVGAAAAVWGLSHYPPAARLLGVAPVEPVTVAQDVTRQTMLADPQRLPDPTEQSAGDADRIAELEARLTRVEQGTSRAVGSAGRADALVVAFAARRAIDRGVALGYLEKLLVERFASNHRQAVAAIVTASHHPVLLEDLTSTYEDLGPRLRSGGAGEGWWAATRHELGSLIQLRSTSRPPSDPAARYARAQRRLEAGEVDQSLAEVMRLPGAANAGPWIEQARRYIAAHRALDEIESAALLRGPTPAPQPAEITPAP